MKIVDFSYNNQRGDGENTPLSVKIAKRPFVKTADLFPSKTELEKQITLIFVLCFFTCR